MKKLIVGIITVLNPNIAMASDMSGLGVLLLVFIILSACVFISIVFFLTRKMTNYKLKRVFRVFSITVFFTPFKIQETGYFWFSGLAFLMGNTDNRLDALITVCVFTFIGYFLYSFISTGANKKVSHKYDWICQACETKNDSESESCINCNCPSNASAIEIKNHQKPLISTSND